jgi:hypothetical protein
MNLLTDISFLPKDGPYKVWSADGHGGMTLHSFDTGSVPLGESTYFTPGDLRAKADAAGHLVLHTEE